LVISYLPDTDEFPWVRVTPVAARRLEVGAMRGDELNASGLDHRRGVIEAHLALAEQFPRAKWLSEGDIVCRDGRLEFLPDGELVHSSERWAIEVELSRKSIPRVRANVEALLTRYERVVYFCAPRVLPLLSSVTAALADDRLEVREVRQPKWMAPSVGRSKKAKRLSGPLSARTRKLLVVITEEGMVAVDQLSELLGSDIQVIQAELAELESCGLVGQGFRLRGSKGWVWATPKGARASGSPVRALEGAGTSRLPTRRAFMSVRIALTGGRRGGRWITRRMLSRGTERGLRSEVAVLVRGSSRAAILVSPEASISTSKMKSEIDRVRHSHDEVLWYCSASSKPAAEGLVAAKGWLNVKVRRLPDG
jgi:hypothetical protein